MLDLLKSDVKVGCKQGGSGDDDHHRRQVGHSVSRAFHPWEVGRAHDALIFPERNLILY